MNVENHRSEQIRIPRVVLWIQLIVKDSPYSFATSREILHRSHTTAAIVSLSLVFVKYIGHVRLEAP
jgi:hypothetical protein